ncbi:hypothetical protein [Acinetobacter tianfuensis]|uniref:Uncharacterized protein n=1 Tax=Acinetobacter tianfuensis TaxID=2419603 RepID=A0A3A8EGJ1_9GAMM|nr:hypothetical protein [Acinetobacter tianfuensis]RKG34062.1 hypothetical protein D7V32_02070 [Acinetobacter tianfuensis]
MLNKLSALFKSNKPDPEQLYLEEHHIQFEEGKGYIVAGAVLNETLAARLAYLSNRRLQSFDDLQALYNTAMIINEKIDLEIANQRYAAHLGNTEENLLAFKQIVKLLNDYYRNFKRARK